MKRSLLLGLALLFGASLLFPVGCGDDKSSDPVNKTEGDPNDPVFVYLQEGFEGMDEAVGVLLEFSMVLADSIFNDPAHPSPGKWSFGENALGADADSFLLTYHDNSQYWYAYASFEYVQDTVTVMSMVVRDSIQFMHGLVPVQWPDSALLTGINAGGALELMAAEEASIEMGQRFSIVGDLPNMGDITIVGEGQVRIEATSVEPNCNFNFDMAHTISNVVANLTELQTGTEYYCPQAGTIRFFGHLNLSCTGDTTFSTSGSWFISQTFNDGQSVTTRFENSTTYWQVTEDCGPGGPPTVAGVIRDHIGLGR